MHPASMCLTLRGVGFDWVLLLPTSVRFDKRSEAYRARLCARTEDANRPRQAKALIPRRISKQRPAFDHVGTRVGACVRARVPRSCPPLPASQDQGGATEGRSLALPLLAVCVGARACPPLLASRDQGGATEGRPLCLCRPSRPPKITVECRRGALSLSLASFLRSQRGCECSAHTDTATDCAFTPSWLPRAQISHCPSGQLCVAQALAT